MSTEEKSNLPTLAFWLLIFSWLALASASIFQMKVITDQRRQLDELHGLLRLEWRTSNDTIGKFIAMTAENQRLNAELKMIRDRQPQYESDPPEIITLPIPTQWPPGIITNIHPIYIMSTNAEGVIYTNSIMEWLTIPHRIPTN